MPLIFHDNVMMAPNNSNPYTFCICSVITCRHLSQHALQLLLYHAFVLAGRSVHIDYTYEYFSYSVLLSAI